MVAIMPRPMSFLMTSPALMPMSLAMSPTVMASSMRMTRLRAAGTVISVFFCSLPGRARFFRSTRPRGDRNSRSLSSMTSCFRMTRFLPLAPLPALSCPSASAGCCPSRAVAGAAVLEGADLAGAGVAFRLKSIRPRIRGPVTVGCPGVAPASSSAGAATPLAPLAASAASGSSSPTGAGDAGSSAPASGPVSA